MRTPAADFVLADFFAEKDTMTPYTQELSYADWLAAKAVISDFLAKSSLGQTVEQRDHNSSALIAQLLHADPVLFVVRTDSVCWADQRCPR